MSGEIVKKDGFSFPANFTEVDRQLFVTQELSKAFFYAGLVPSKDDLQLMVIIVARMIERDYPFLTNTDISEAIECGVLGRYGDFYGINARSVDSWLRNYSIKKREALNKQKRNDEIKASRKDQIPTVERSRSILQLLQKNEDKVPSLRRLINKYTKDNSDGTDIH